MNCDADEYKFYSVIAAVNLALWLGGIPVLFSYLIRHRDEPWAAVGSLPLHANFTPDLAYYEVFELLRKMLLIAVVQFVFPNTSTQCVYLLAVDITALLVLSISRPYLADPDDFLSGTLILIECMLFFVAFLIVSNVDNLENYSQSSLMEFSLTLIILALCVFVPLNIVQKLNWIKHYFQEWDGILNQILSKTGLNYFFIQGFSARSRYVAETEELRETVQIMRASMIDSELPLETYREIYGVNRNSPKIIFSDQVMKTDSNIRRNSEREVRSNLVQGMEKSDSSSYGYKTSSLQTATSFLNNKNEGLQDNQLCDESITEKKKSIEMRKSIRKVELGVYNSP